MITSIDTSAVSLPDTSAGGGSMGKTLLIIGLLGLGAWAIYNYVIKPKEEQKKQE